MENLTILKLKSSKKEDLVKLINDSVLKIPEGLEEKSKSELITYIQDNLNGEDKLSSELSKLNYSFKPSFYLTFIKDKSSYSHKLVTQNEIQGRLKKLNREKDKENRPAIREYRLIKIKRSGDLIELHFLWETIHWFWNPNYKLDNIYELNYGLALIDLKNKKGIISCHTKKERDDLFRVIFEALKIELKPLNLTKPLLDQIGTFDSVKRARYFVSNNELSLPENITIGDDNLSTKQLAREQEENVDVSRKESFYRIPIRGVEEQGVGVTSETGKLWIPQQTTVSEIKDFGFKLLSKVAQELDSLSESGDSQNVIDALGIRKSKALLSISNLKVRDEIFRLFISLSNMLINKETEKAFTPNENLLDKAIPLYFNPFNLIMSGEIGNYFYEDVENLFKLDNGEEKKLVGHFTKKEISEIVEKDSGEIISVKEVLENILLTPTSKLETILLQLIKLLATQYPDLNNVISLPFRIESNLLKLNYKRAIGLGQSNEITHFKPNEINELKQVLIKNYSLPVLPDNILELLGEKCKHMSDQNCLNCVEQNKFLCLRTLVARTMKKHYLLAHKGIELSDLQGEYNYNNTNLKLFVFAKLGVGKVGLTARNKNGAILLGQILNQIYKSEFNTVSILTSSIINEDLLSNIKLLCSTFGKKLLIINEKELEKLLGYWYEEMVLQDLEPLKILRNSKDSIRKKVKLSNKNSNK